MASTESSDDAVVALGIAIMGVPQGYPLRQHWKVLDPIHPPLSLLTRVSTALGAATAVPFLWGKITRIVRLNSHDTVFLLRSNNIDDFGDGICLHVDFDWDASPRLIAYLRVLLCGGYFLTPDVCETNLVLQTGALTNNALEQEDTNHDEGSGTANSLAVVLTTSQPQLHPPLRVALPKLEQVHLRNERSETSFASSSKITPYLG